MLNDFLKQCKVCGRFHESENCPPNSFAVITCSCGSNTVILADTAFALPYIICTDCDITGEWTIKPATEKILKKYLKNYERMTV